LRVDAGAVGGPAGAEQGALGWRASDGRELGRGALERSGVAGALSRASGGQARCRARSWAAGGRLRARDASRRRAGVSLEEAGVVRVLRRVGGVLNGAEAGGCGTRRSRPWSKLSEAVVAGAVRARERGGSMALTGRRWAGLALAGAPALAGLRSGFSRFGLFREISARAVRQFGHKLEEKIGDSERNKRNWG
jgi:hypothetical protein